jgi:hypothetical protein
MSKTTPIGVRVSLETKDALARAAKDDLRSMASLVEKILTDWLKENGYAPEPPKSRPTTRRRKVEMLEAVA